MENKTFILLTISLFLLLLKLASGASGDPQNGSTTTSNHSAGQSALQAKLNETVSKVIEAFEENSYPEEPPSQEHKKGRIMARKGVDMNATTTTTTATAIVLTSEPMPKGSEAQQHNISLPLTSNISTSSNNTIAAGAGNVAKVNATTPTSTSNSNVSAVTSSTSKPALTNTTAAASSSTTTTTTTTTSTTTKSPKKPKITYSVDDEPKLIQAAKPGYDSLSSVAGTTGLSDANGRLHVEEPLVELSKEYIPAAMMGPPGGHREFVIPVVTLIFAIPLLMGLFLLSYRRAKEFWLTRHYRRMDFLVDGMYNY
ncbi:uncharacterized protein LOC131682224 [Topomyia yanbarensis]|uniref:uncharacterized protein LOC131682224 n=1 Tax=Topomyia yanbarensis TaxID=2498891 RepID=UPI00273C8E01|nr:uncharacterized protein LOC131682224 [Topomyia yanbarensis]